jgi:cyclic pyranopterin phosphate synthase
MTVAVPVHLGRPRPATAPDDTLGATPTAGPLLDSYDRIHTDLRISVTDRCNLRCTYCMPEEGMSFLPHDQLMTDDEIVRVARVAHELGVTSARLTGGEPLARRGVVALVARLAGVGFADLALTTNGTALAPVAARLADAGLHRVNVSCDSLRPDRFAQIRRRGELARVLASMDAAEGAGLTPIKVNVVLVAGVNDDEVLDFARFARETGRIVRYIEYMPLDADGTWRRDQVVPGARVLATIDAHWPLEPVAVADDDGAPATRYRFRDGSGEIGIIASVTQPFCGTCNRLRLTADGTIRNCLFCDEELSVRDVLARGGGDAEIALLLRRAVWSKRAGHGMDDPGFLRPARSMSMIGG